MELIRLKLLNQIDLCLLDREKAVSLLLSKGANDRIKNNEGWEPKDFAAKFGKIVEMDLFTMQKT